MAQVSRELGEVLSRFESWRRTRASRRERIPQGLWQAAVAASARNGISRTARVLRLNEQELRRRCGAGASGRVRKTSGSQPQAGFVEVRPPVLGEPGASWVVEVEAPAGARLRIERRGEGTLDVASLAAALLRVVS